MREKFQGALVAAAMWSPAPTTHLLTRACVLVRRDNEPKLTASGRRILHETADDEDQTSGFTRACILPKSVDRMDSDALESAVLKAIQETCDHVASAVYGDIMATPAKFSPCVVVPAKDETEITMITVSHDDERFVQALDTYIRQLNMVNVLGTSLTFVKLDVAPRRPRDACRRRSTAPQPSPSSCR